MIESSGNSACLLTGSAAAWRLDPAAPTGVAFANYPNSAPN
jgi:hypothetical protein